MSQEKYIGMGSPRNAISLTTSQPALNADLSFS
jgi:hypothetical protein